MIDIDEIAQDVGYDRDTGEGSVELLIDYKNALEDAIGLENAREREEDVGKATVALTAALRGLYAALDDDGAAVGEVLYACDKAVRRSAAESVEGQIAREEADLGPDLGGSRMEIQ